MMLNDANNAIATTKSQKRTGDIVSPGSLYEYPHAAEDDADFERPEEEIRSVSVVHLSHSSTRHFGT